MAGRQQSDELEVGVDRDPENPDDVSRFVEWYEQYAENTLTTRALQVRDVQYIHHKQWSKEDIEKLEARGQPLVTYNRIAPKINFIRGYETRTRVDPCAKPRTPAHHDDAVAATDALRYAADRAEFDRQRSVVTQELLGWGEGGVVLGVDEDREITLSPVRGDRFFRDPHSTEADYLDGRFLGVVVWWDYDDIITEPMYAGKSDIIEEALDNRVGDTASWDPHEDKPEVWVDPVRKRVRVVEIYFRDMAPALDGDKEPILGEDGEPKQRKEWHVCHFTKAGALIPSKVVEWRDEKGHTFCPLIATSAFVDDENNRYGIVRGMISPQDEINKRRSRALWEAIMRTFMYEDGSIEDPDEFATQVARADGKAKVEEGTLSEGTAPKVKFLDAAGQSGDNLALYQDAKQEINDSGPSMPSIAGDQSALSGRAILAKQNIGSMELETIFDNLRGWQKRVFTGMWWMIRMLWTEEKFLRVRDSIRKEGYRFVRLNGQMTRAERLLELVQEHEVPIDSAVRQIGLHPIDAQRLFAEAQQMARTEMNQHVQQMQQMGQQPQQQQMQQQNEQYVLAKMIEAPLLREPIRVHDMAAVEVDIIIDVSPDTTIAAQEEFAELLKLSSQGIWTIPNPAIQKALVENSSLRKKDTLLAAIDKPPDPAQVQHQQQQMQLSIKSLMANIQKVEAEVGRLRAASARDMAEAQVTAPAEAQRTQATAQRTMAQTQRDLAQANIGIPAMAERNRAAAVNELASAQASSVTAPAKAERDIATGVRELTLADSQPTQGRS